MELKLKIMIATIFGLVFPLFGIFLYTKFEFMGLNLWSNILNHFSSNFSYAFFQWLFSIFRGDMINQIQLYGVYVFIKQPFMSSLFMWCLHGYFIGIFVKKIKQSVLISLGTFCILLVLFLIFMFVCNSLYSTVDLVFGSGPIFFIGGILFCPLSLISSIIGVKIGS
ncbi:MAG: hypothetical protein ACTSRZ_01855 [Promethearchaeota archaeon]